MATKVPDRIRGLERVGRALTERNEELVAEMVQRIREEVPAYSKVDPSVFERIRELAGPTAFGDQCRVDRTHPGSTRRYPDYQGAGRRPPSDRDRPRLMSVCLPRRAVLVLGRGDGGGNTAASLPHRGARFGRFVLDSIDTITTHAAEAYLREDNRIRTQTGRAVADLIDGVLAGQPTLQQLPVAPGISPSRPVQIVIARVIDTNDDINTALTSVLEILDANLAIGAAAPLSTIRHQEIVAIVPGSPPISRLHTAARCARERKQILIGIGVSDSPTGFAGAPNAYAEAALTLGYTSPTRPVVALAELRARQLLLLGAGDTTRQLVSEKGRHLQLLPAKERDAAIETILAFSASNMSISAAASALGIHPNTVRYRLARVAQTTGLDPRTFPGLADLHCIIELSRRHSRDATGETTRPPRDQSAAIPKTRAGSVGAGDGSRDKARAAGPG